jgi:hypothetical protein
MSSSFIYFSLFVSLFLRQCLAMWPKMAWNLWSSCLSLLGAGIIDMNPTPSLSLCLYIHTILWDSNFTLLILFPRLLMLCFSFFKSSYFCAVQLGDFLLFCLKFADILFYHVEAAPFIGLFISQIIVLFYRRPTDLFYFFHSSSNILMSLFF